MARKKTSGKPQKTRSTSKSTKKVVSSKPKQLNKNKKATSNLNRLKQSAVESKQKLGKGIGLQRWNYVRTQAKEFLASRNIKPTKKELLDYSSALYKEVKDDFKNKSRAMDLVMDDYFFGSDKIGILSSFPWWELDNTLGSLRGMDLIVVDNEKAGLTSFETTVIDFRVRYASQNTANINSIYQRKEYASYLSYKKEVNGIDINYFLLVSDDDPLMDADDADFEAWMMSESIDLKQILGRLEHKIDRNAIEREEKPEEIPFQSGYVEPMKRIPKRVPEIKKEPPVSKGKQSINAAKEVAKMKKKRQHTVLIRELEKGGLNAKQILAVIRKIK